MWIYIYWPTYQLSAFKYKELSVSAKMFISVHPYIKYIVQTWFTVPPYSSFRNETEKTCSEQSKTQIKALNTQINVCVAVLPVQLIYKLLIIFKLRRQWEWCSMAKKTSDTIIVSLWQSWGHLGAPIMAASKSPCLMQRTTGSRRKQSACTLWNSLLIKQDFWIFLFAYSILQTVQNINAVQMDRTKTSKLQNFLTLHIVFIS